MIAMSVKVKRGIVLLITIMLAAVWGYESSILFESNAITILLSMGGGFIIGFVGSTIRGKITE